VADELQIKKKKTIGITVTITVTLLSCRYVVCHFKCLSSLKQDGFSLAVKNQSESNSNNVLLSLNLWFGLCSSLYLERLLLLLWLLSLVWKE